MSEKPYEYLDHTADIQFHAWGSNIREAFENTALAMFDYVTDLSTVEIDESLDDEMSVEGHDMESLLFAFMDELLYQFCAENFRVCKEVKITLFDRNSFKIKCNVRGERFKIGKHPQNADIKAITYSNMQIHETPERTDVFIIVDI